MIPNEILSFPSRAMTQTERERYFGEGYVLIEAATGSCIARPGLVDDPLDVDSAIWSIRSHADV
jgi:hypothetical protein